jgi:hypothetical protein
MTIAVRSCTTNLLSTLNEWTCLLDEREPVDALYLDFAKAFESVPHERLLRKLQSLGIDSNVFKWIRDFLVGRRQRVSINGSVSEWASVRSGVPCTGVTKTYGTTVLGPRCIVVVKGHSSSRWVLYVLSCYWKYTSVLVSVFVSWLSHTYHKEAFSDLFYSLRL